MSSNPGLIPNPSINYTSPNATGSLTYAPLPDVSGQAIILVTVMDDGGTTNGGINTLTRSFVVTVTPVNQAPTLNPIQDPQPVFENSINALSPATINLSGITDGPGDTGQVLSVTAVSSNPALVPNPSVVYTNPNTTGTLLYSLAPNASGKATITVTVTDDGGTANGGVNTFSQTFNVVVLPVNQAPTLGPIAHAEPDPRELGGGDDQPQRHHRRPGRHAEPGHRDHEPHAGDHRHPHGQLHQPEDDRHAHHRAAGFRHRHGDVRGQRGGRRRHRQRRRERLCPAARHGDGQSGQPAAQHQPDHQHHDPREFGAGDGHGVHCRRFGQRDQRDVRRRPRLVPVRAIPVPADGHDRTSGQWHGGDGDRLAEQQRHRQRDPDHQSWHGLHRGPGGHDWTLNVSLLGINPGTGDVGQVVFSPTAVSSNPDLIPKPSITYPNTNPTTGLADLTSGTLNYTPVPNASGTAIITVTVTDNGGTANGGKNTFTETFSITVLPVNQAPTLNPISPNPLVLPLSPGPQTVPLTGISDGLNNPPTSLTSRSAAATRP